LFLFAGMGAVATLLTIGLIALDRWKCLGFFDAGIPGAPPSEAPGGLNQSSFETGLAYDRLQRSKDRFLQKERRWREVAKQQQEEQEQEAAMQRVEDGLSAQPTQQQQPKRNQQDKV